MTPVGVGGGDGASVRALLHELNNVLSAILGYAEIVHDDAGQGRVEERDAIQILTATRRAIELADQLAAALRLERSGDSAAEASGSEPRDAS